MTGKRSNTFETNFKVKQNNAANLHSFHFASLYLIENELPLHCRLKDVDK